MIIVSDTSPICYLLLIEKIEILPALYNVVIIPQAVADELSSVYAPSLIQNWIAQPPSWLQIESVTIINDPQLEKLDLGEREAILLAEKLEADLVILDDKSARQIATDRGLNIIGLLGILKDGAKLNLLGLKITFEQLREVGFWVAPNLLKQLLD